MSKNLTKSKIKNINEKEVIIPEGEEIEEPGEIKDTEEEEIEKMISKPPRVKKQVSVSFEDELLERELERENWD